MNDFPTHLFVSIDDINDTNKKQMLTHIQQQIVDNFNTELLNGYLAIMKDPRHPAVNYMYEPRNFNDWIETEYIFNDSK